MTRRVVPIDIDFAGWTEVEAGAHNAWGVVEERDCSDWLVSWHSMKFHADRAAIADTHPKDGDVKQAPLVSGGGSEGNRP